MGYNWIYLGSKMFAPCQPMDTIWICRKYIVLKSLISYFTFLMNLNGTLDRKCLTRNDCSDIVLVTDSLSWIRDS
jgi:hypothetical protein